MMSETPKQTITLPTAPQAQPARVEAEKKARRRRADTSETRNMKLSVPPEQLDPNFSYRWFNDTPGRIHDKTVNDDWEIVEKASEHVPTRRHVGAEITGQSREAVLLRKPKAFYEEDKGKEQRRITEREEAMRRGVTEDSKGLPGPNVYVPGGEQSNRIGR